MSAPVTNGANALKLENEIINENDHIDSPSGIMSDNHTTSEELKVENIVEDSSISEYEQSFTEEALETINEKEESETSNGLENFGVDIYYFKFEIYFNILNYFFLIKLIKKLIKEKKISIIHCHVSFSEVIGSIIKFLLSDKIKLIILKHTDILLF